MKRFILIFFLFLSNQILFAQDKSDSAAKIKKLENKVLMLEKRIQVLEKTIASSNIKVVEDTNLIRLKKKAKQRVSQDYINFPVDRVSDAERLYSLASRDINSDESKKIFREIIENYPRMNRAGCSALYLAQSAEKNEQEKLYSEAYEKFGDCMYLDGVEVGAYARYKLALIYRERNEVEKAKELMRYIRNNFHNAVNHDGKKLEMDLHD